MMQSWLRKRAAHVVVSGHKSDAMTLVDMVFQGTVWGPPLWNAFYADSRRPIRNSGFVEIIFADDLNAWKKFSAGSAHDTMMTAMAGCQRELHKWGGPTRSASIKTKIECTF